MKTTIPFQVCAPGPESTETPAQVREPIHKYTILFQSAKLKTKIPRLAIAKRGIDNPVDAGRPA